MKNICQKCKKPKVTFLQGKTKDSGTYIPCGCKEEVRKKYKQPYSKLVMSAKIRLDRKNIIDRDRFDLDMQELKESKINYKN